MFDLDGTLCQTVNGDYATAMPYRARIAAVNKLYDDGHTVLVDSARGSVSGEDWQARTATQLRAWGLKFTDVRTGVKWYGDVYVDDHGWPDLAFFGDTSDHAH